MKLLVFEYITGGGLANRDLPISLATEGRMMLQALLDDLKSVPELELILPLDRRCTDLSLPPNTHVVPVGRCDDINQVLRGLIAESDRVWPIAPETDGILADIARQVKISGKTLLLSDPETIALCANKLATYGHLHAQDLPVVETLSLSRLGYCPFEEAVIKPIDGVGCEGSRIIDDSLPFQTTISDPAAYVLQPLMTGPAVSLSCLFKQSRAWLLCCNRQEVVVEGRQFYLQACLVNTVNEHRDYYQALVERVAQAVPGLWGYVGIDLIESAEQGPLILEINPRLTTSYVGILQATGINVAEQTLSLLKGEPKLTFTDQQTVKVVIH